MTHNILRPRIEKQSILDELAKMQSSPAPASPPEIHEEEPTADAIEPREIKDLRSYIILSGREHKESTGTYAYDDLFVAAQRLSFSLQVAQASKQLGLNLENTALKSDKHAYDYIGNIKWQEALKTNLMLGGQTLNARQGIDFLADLKDGIEGRKTLYYADGSPIKPSFLKIIYNDIVKVREPWRAEWLDADFKFANGVMSINYDHKLQNGVLVPARKEPLEAYLDRQGVKVSFKDFNRHGLPKADDNNGEIHYWKPLPDNNSVARFDADSGRAIIYCNRNPDSYYASLGVRFVREKNLGGIK